MQTRLIIGGAALAAIIVGTTACHPVRRALHIDDNRPMSVVTPLDCPDRQGDLIKVSAAADGRSCAYRNDQGEDVALSLLPLNGQSPQMALTPLETELRAIAPHGDEDADDDHDNDAAANKPDKDGDEAHDHAKVDLPFVHVDADKSHGHDRAKVDVPFVHVDADDDKAHVKVLGVTIDADNDNANVHTNWGSKSATIKAGPEGAEIRAVDTRRGAADLLFILAGDQAGPSGYHSVGYVARGPSNGPLVVATFKNRANRQHRDFHEHDVDELVKRNLKS